MSHRVLEDACIGCGGCEYACPTGALTKTDSYLGLFVIDPFTCDDCGLCVDKCPVVAIEPDPAWAVCGDRGCPLRSKRLADVECSVWQQRCPACGATLWRAGGDGDWSCPRCGMGMKVACPRTNQATTSPVAAPTTGASLA
jgi:ferredoxin